MKRSAGLSSDETLETLLTYGENRLTPFSRFFFHMETLFEENLRFRFIVSQKNSADFVVNFCHFIPKTFSGLGNRSRCRCL
jgi:hypothetical protein